MKRFALTAGIVLFAAAASWACNPVFVHKQVVVVPQVVVFPAYAISYDAEKAGLIDALNRLTLAVEKLQSDGQQKTQSGLAVMQRNCAACHGAAAHEAKGGGFPLLTEAGELETLSLAEKRRIAQRITSSDPAKRMPAGKPPLTEDEMKAILAQIGAMK